MEHITSTERGVTWKRSVRVCLLLISLAGCETSNAVITGTPVAGQTGSATGSSSVAGQMGTAGLSAPAASGGSTAGISGGNSMPPVSSATAGTSSAPSATAGTSSAASATAGTSSAPSATAGTSSSAGGSGGSQAGAPAGASGSAATPSGEGCRAAKYSLGVRLTVDVKWEESLALVGGTDKGYVWSKLTIDPSSNTVSEYRSCGTLMPVVHTTALAGNTMSFQRVPVESYDKPTMPKQSGGSATRVDATLKLDPGALLVGLTLSDPAGPWPASGSDPKVMPADADGDGKPGLTSAMRDGGGFVGAPTSILATSRLDATYQASRVQFRAMLNDSSCGDALEGPAELLKLETLIVGCHVKGGNDCTPEESQFIDENRPPFMFAAGAMARAVVVPNDATCAQVLEMLNVPGP